MIDNKIDVGTVLVCSWGYNMSKVDFYTVIERQGQWATFQRVGKQSAGYDFCPEWVFPSDAVIGRPIRSKVRESMGVEYVSCRASIALPWSGQALYQSHTN